MLKNFTVLYVEDNKEVVENIIDILGEKVKELYVAYNGEEGLDLFKEKNPDIVLTDINMPKMNGMKMSKEIKKIDEEKPILILTAFNENALLHESVEIGVDGYITKPIIELEKLIDPIKKVADRLQGYRDKEHLKHILEVQSKNAAMGEMIGNIAHQWRQPLSVITTSTSGIKLEMELGSKITNEDIIKCIDNVNAQANYLSSTIDDFRNFFTSDLSVLKNINLNEVLEDTKKLIYSVMHDNFIEEVCNFQENIIVYGNKNLLVQAIINICNNAKDQLVEVEDSDDRYFFVSTKVEDNNAVIVLKDSGSGIPAEIMDKIFEPYFTTKHQSRGTGIGLYMAVNVITREFNGTIDVENVEYKYDNKELNGAQFTIRIPIEKG